MMDVRGVMSTTSHKSMTRIKSEAAMKQRIHTSRKNRDLTADGLDKHHHEARTLRAIAGRGRVKTSAKAASAKRAVMRGA